METLEEYLKIDPLRDPEDIDALLALAELTRELIRDERYEEIGTLIRFTTANGHFEALSWVLSLLQERCRDRALPPFRELICDLGTSIPDFDSFTATLQVEPAVLNNDVRFEYDDNEEVRSFLNILTYRMKFENIFLISAESFDTLDNDSIQYRLWITADPPGNAP